MSIYNYQFPSIYIITNHKTCRKDNKEEINKKQNEKYHEKMNNMSEIEREEMNRKLREKRALKKLKNQNV